MNRERLLAAAAKRLRSLEVAKCFDPIDPDSRPTPDQLAILNDLDKISSRYVTAGNQTGKSQIGAREVSWIWTETHPKWSRPARWGDEPLLMIVAGRTTKQIEDNLWRKISQFVPVSDYKLQRVGGILQKATHVNGNVILFLSHHNENEAREKMQAFVAHYVWCDEMPGSSKVFEELSRRVQSRDGYFLATFTPKVRNDDIRKLVDNAKAPFSRKYQLKMFDNPALAESRKAEIMHELEAYPESYRNTVLFGHWSAGENAVYDFRVEDHVAQSVPNYSKGWRHCVVVDPAMAGELGLTLWAECPSNHVWYCVLAEYVKGLYAPSDLVTAVESKVRGYNIVRRVYDPHEPWYAREANKLGFTYIPVNKKHDRKHELIKQVQTALSQGVIQVCSWCIHLIDEFHGCQWSETNPDRIIASQKYHLLDCVQYFVDTRPLDQTPAEPQPFHQALREAHRRNVRVSKQKVKGKKWRLRSGSHSQYWQAWPFFRV